MKKMLILGASGASNSPYFRGRNMTKKLSISIFTLLTVTTQAHAIDIKYRQQLIDSGCTQVSELQGCDINKTKAENTAAGFIKAVPVANADRENQTKKSPYAGSWIAATGDSGDKIATLHIDSNEHVKVNGTAVKAKRSDGTLVFTQGFIIYTIQGDRRIKGEDYWFDTDAKSKGPINKKK